MKPTRGRCVGMSKIVRRSGYGTLRPVPPGISRIAFATHRIPTRRIPGSVPSAPTRSRNVWRCHGLRVPNLGGNREEFVLRFGELCEAESLQHPAPEGMAKGRTRRTGRFRVTAPLLRMQVVLAPTVQALHTVFPEIELRLRTAARRQEAQPLVDGRNDLHCGGLNTGETLPAHLRREPILDVTARNLAVRSPATSPADAGSTSTARPQPASTDRL